MNTEHKYLVRLARRLRKQRQALDPEEVTFMIGIHRREPIRRDAKTVSAEHSALGKRHSDSVAAVGGTFEYEGGSAHRATTRPDCCSDRCRSN